MRVLALPATTTIVELDTLARHQKYSLPSPGAKGKRPSNQRRVSAPTPSTAVCPLTFAKSACVRTNAL